MFKEYSITYFRLLKLKILKKKCLELGSMNDSAFKILLEKFNVFIKENAFHSIPESSNTTKKNQDILEEITVIGKKIVQFFFLKFSKKKNNHFQRNRKKMCHLIKMTS